MSQSGKHETRPLSEAQEKRYKYLLGQTDLFAHFIRAKSEGKSVLESLIKDGEKSSKQRRPPSDEDTRHHRKSEKEEDEELLQAEKEDVDNVPSAIAVPAIFTESPPYVKGGKLRTYQIQGLNWLISLHENFINGILADEMGLGKTLQTLALLGYLKFMREIDGPHLLVVPKSTLQNWLNEVNRWIPDLRAFIFHGSKEERHEQIHGHLLDVGSYDICITSYEVCLIEKASIRKINWHYLIIDEAHRIKNEQSMLSQIVREFRSKHRLLITGTPLQNNLHELWALLNFLLPDIFGSSEDFDSWFTASAEEESKDQDILVQQLRRLLQPFLLRRLKADVEHSLLPKKEVNLYTGMSEMQRTWYQRILERDIEAINGQARGKDSKTRLLNIVMQLRKCCNHPYLFDGAEPGPPFTTDEHLVQNSTKLGVLDVLLKKMKERGSRVLLFSQMSRMLDILEDYCTMRGWNFCRLDGSTAHEDRIQAIEEYNRPGSDKFIFLLTTRAGGLGINLATADIVILYDSDWNPQVDLQAQDRAHRIGQTKQVCVFRLITENSVEEKIIERALQKLRLDQLVIQQGRLANANKPMTQDEMLAMIRHGAQDIFQGKDNKAHDGINEDEVEEILKRGEEKTRELMSKYQNAGLDDLQRFTTIDTASYQHVDEAGNPVTSFAPLAWLQPDPSTRRERSKINYSIDGFYREALGEKSGQPSGKGGKARAPLPPGHPHIIDFQFFPLELSDLLEREKLAYQKSVGYVIPEPDKPEQRAERDAIQAAIDSAQPLTQSERRRRDTMLQEGFSDWTRKDFQAFCRACEKYGRKDVTSIASEVEGKTLDQIKAYSKVFWKRFGELTDSDKLLSAIERGEAKIVRAGAINNLLRTRVKQSGGKPLPIPYHLEHHNLIKALRSTWTEEEDRFLIRAMSEIGYAPDSGTNPASGVWEALKVAIDNEPSFAFDWYIRTRTVQELSKRFHKLLSLLEKEEDQLASDAPKRKAPLSEKAAKAQKSTIDRITEARRAYRASH